MPHGRHAGTAALKLRDAMPVRTVVTTVRTGVDQGKRLEAEVATLGTARDNDLVLTDPTVSGYHARLSAVKSGIQIEDLGSKNGTTVNGVRVERGIAAPGALIEIGQTRLAIEAGLPLTVELHAEDRLGDLRGATSAMRRLMSDIRKLAAGTVPVLVSGESGTGKELIARAIHDASARSDAPFVTVDCGSLAPALVASELFGHEQGAFTGAHRTKRGAFELAHGGTLFLDEIGELPAELQANLLGALERRRFCRVGGRSEIEVDLRVVAATHRDLRREVNAGTFRLDLYYRLAVVTLAVPPLRDRAADIPLLVEHFARAEGYAGAIEERFPRETMERLKAHPWRGNIRELRNFVQATLAMGEPAQLDDTSAPGARGNSVSLVPTELLALPYGRARALLVERFEESYARALLERAGGNVAKAAREGEIARSHLNLLIRKHDLKP